MTLAVLEPTAQLTALESLRDDAERFAEESRASSTRRAYASDMAHFRGWCREHGVIAVPADPAAAALYLTACAQTLKLASISRRIAAIAGEHRKAGFPSPFFVPQVQDVWRGIRRTLGAAQDAKTPLLIDDLRKILEPLGDSSIDRRDQALLLLGFGGAFRRSEIVAFDVRDVRFVTNGLEVTLRRSKTDQEGSGRLIGVPYGSRMTTCPVRALQAWLDRSGITEGALFRSVDRHGNVGARIPVDAVAVVVKRHMKRAGFDPDRYAGHSLRSGFVTTAAIAGVGLADIATQTGHKSLGMVMRYMRPATIWHQNAAEKVGL